MEVEARIQKSDFVRVDKAQVVHQLSRPSLSFWQDAWLRLKKNKKAITSFYLILGLLIFTLLGPWIWPLDPAEQNLNHISQKPSFKRKVMIYSEDGGAVFQEENRVDSFTSSSAVGAEDLNKPERVWVEGNATTKYVRLRWTPVDGAKGYAIYRSEALPNSSSHLGIPIATLTGANQLGYEDRLKLDPGHFIYSVVPTDGLNESSRFSTVAVDVFEGLPLTVGQKIKADVKVGEILTLRGHPLGTDYLGRDLLARLMFGARVSLFVGIVAPLLFVFFGALYGGLSGYFGGQVDSIMMRFADFVVALPFLLFMILFKISFGIGPGESGIFPMLVALVLLSWPSPARLIRGEILRLREEGFIQAARLMGAHPIYLLTRHLIPNTMGVLLVTLTFAVPSAIFTEAFLSFIGMGVVPPTPSWGSMCNEGVKTVTNHPHELFFPAFLISMTVLSFNLLGDGLRDAMDARLRSRE